MNEFMDEDFLLRDESSRRLYHDYAESMPVIDYHCHLPPAAIASDARLGTIAQAWLGGDHYKWRVMRANGVSEADVTGREPDYASFLAWARTVPRLVGNPLYHWTHLELRRYFGIRESLSEATAPAIWEACNEALARPEYGARSLLRKMAVRAVATTDDPADGLAHHATYAAARGPGDPVMVPSFRPDKALAVEDQEAWKAYLARLGAAAGREIASYEGLVAALELRHEAFHLAGCRSSDHALISPIARPASGPAARASFESALSGRALGREEAEALRAALLFEVGRMDARKGWAMQLHMGSLRNLNSRAFRRLGPDTGYDAACDEPLARGLAAFLDALEAEGSLPKTVLYSLNPGDYESLATIMGCFQDGSVPGKMQLGSAWWFNDHIEGMARQLASLASLGLLSRFVGMLTDSRSFLSFPRHEYFRRILCGLVGGWIERGEAPADFEALGALVRDISYRNARDYFAIPGLEG
jgi:glucuronate isomerase